MSEGAIEKRYGMSARVVQGEPPTQPPPKPADARSSTPDREEAIRALWEAAIALCGQIEKDSFPLLKESVRNKDLAWIGVVFEYVNQVNQQKTIIEAVARRKGEDITLDTPVFYSEGMQYSDREEAIRALWEAATDSWRGRGDSLAAELEAELVESSITLPGRALRGKDLYWIGVALGYISDDDSFCRKFER